MIPIFIFWWSWSCQLVKHDKWQVFHQKEQTQLYSSISKQDYLKTIPLLFSITLHPLFTFLTILELIFQFRNRNYEKIWTFYEERTPFSRSVSSVLSFFHSISFPQSKFKNSDQSHKTLINSVIMLGTPMKNSPYAR